MSRKLDKKKTKTLTQEAARAIWFCTSTIPATTSRNDNYRPSFQCNAPPNPTDEEKNTLKTQFD